MGEVITSGASIAHIEKDVRDSHRTASARGGDVAAAAATATTMAERIKAPADVRAEPWPPMKAGEDL